MPASFPTSVPTTAELRGNLVDNLATLLTVAIDADDTTLEVDDTTDFPTSGLLSLKTASGGGIIEVVSYTGKTATTFTGVTRNFNGRGAQAYSIDDEVNQYWVADHHNHMVEELIAIAQNLSDRIGLDPDYIVIPAGKYIIFEHPSGGVYSKIYFLDDGTFQYDTVTYP